MLEVSGLEAAYGPSQVLFGIDLRVGAGEVVTLLGRNGMGKTTTVRAIMGLMPAKAGAIAFEGRPIAGLPSYKVAQCGLGIVPEGRQIFPNLTVEENLLATARPPKGDTSAEPWTLLRVYGLFPRLKERAQNMGNQLSGGEQQMLAVGRALMTNPRLLILDEATEGLAPIIRHEIWGVIRLLKKSGLASVIVDKNVTTLLELADRNVILVKGKVAFDGPSAELARDPQLLTTHLGI
jgi:branched-chain amino acid transport system ATP-binding protein